MRRVREGYQGLQQSVVCRYVGGVGVSRALNHIESTHKQSERDTAIVPERPDLR